MPAPEMLSNTTIPLTAPCNCHRDPEATGFAGATLGSRSFYIRKDPVADLTPGSRRFSHPQAF
jgi:hypothetical protein